MKPLSAQKRVVSFHRLCASAGSLSLLTIGLTTCLGAAPTSTACMPPAYSLTPTVSALGETVTVSAHEATCNPRYGPNAQIEITMIDSQGKNGLHVIAPMEDSGKFRFSFTVPSDTSLGDASVTAIPHGVDWCDDTGKNNRVDTGVMLVRASCAVPAEPLSITN